MKKSVSVRFARWAQILILCVMSIGPVYATLPAQENLLVKIISEPEDMLIHDIFLEVDAQNELQKLIRRSKVDEQAISFEELNDKEVVLARAQNRDAIFISCQNCHRAYGGKVVLRYLTNGLLNKFENFAMMLEVQDGKWMLETIPDKGEPIRIHTLRLRSRMVGDIVIGIRKIVVNENPALENFLMD